MNRTRTHVASHPAAQPAFVADNLRYCGFECPACGFQHRLSDSSGGTLLLELFRVDGQEHEIACPECGTKTSFTRSDLQLFKGKGED